MIKLFVTDFPFVKRLTMVDGFNLSAIQFLHQPDGSVVDSVNECVKTSTPFGMNASFTHFAFFFLHAIMKNVRNIRICERKAVHDILFLQ